MRHSPHTMPSVETRCAILHFIGLALVIQLCLPVIKQTVLCLFTRNNGYSARGCDGRHGEGDEKTSWHAGGATRRQMRPWILVAVVTGGCAVAFVRAVNRQSRQLATEPWVQCLVWVFMLLQYIAIATERMDTARASTLQAAFDLAKGQMKPSNLTLWQILPLLYRRHFIWQVALSIPLASLAFAPHVALGQMLLLLESPTERQTNAFLLVKWAAVLGLGIGLSSWLENWLLWIAESRISIPMRQQLSTALFDKATRLTSPNGDENKRGSTKAHNVINLAAIDAARIATMAGFLYSCMLQPLKVIVACMLLSQLLGWQSLSVGLMCLVLISPLHSACLKRISTAEHSLMSCRDTKMSTVTEALHGIRYIKFSAIESKWEEKVNRLRDNELRAQRFVFHWQVLSLTLHLLGPVLVSAASLGMYGRLYGRLTPSVAFPAFSILGYLQFTIGIIPELLSGIVAACVSMKRVDGFLEAPETVRHVSHNDCIGICAESLSYGSDDSSNQVGVLNQVDLRFPHQMLSLICGPTGVGKSLLLAALLGECKIGTGAVKRPKPALSNKIYTAFPSEPCWIVDSMMAYVAQVPWIEAGTVRANILFGLPLDVQRYQKVVNACALTHDLNEFIDHDLTDIGPSGVNLSGGQKARVSLARALYSRAGILILDDIFSAVDVHTAKHVFEHALTGELAEGRTRVLVTHHVDLSFGKTDYVVQLEHGKVKYAGEIQDLHSSGDLVPLRTNKHQPSTVGNVTNGEAENLIMPGTEKKFVQEENRGQGATQWLLFRRYIEYSGDWPRWSILAGCYVAYNILILAQYWWMNIWTAGSESAASYVETWYYFRIYLGLAVIVCLVGALRSYIAMTISLQASSHLFRRLLHVVLRTRMQWLDTVPVGRILNRFTADFYILDSRLGLDLTTLLSSGMDCIGVIMGAVIVQPILLLFGALLLYGAFWYTGRYLAAAREVKRLECVARSPIYEHFSSSMEGIVTIRAFQRTQHYVTQMQEKVERHAQAVWHLALFNQWFTFRINALGALFSLVTALAVIWREDVTGSMAGFALVFTNHLCFALVSLSRAYATLEMDMNGVDRILEYSDLPTEDGSGHIPSSAWPAGGRLAVSDLKVAYAADSPAVLRNVTFEALPGERIGIVGRTGAGKSSLALALFRFLEVPRGAICIDGIDISTIALGHLRRHLAIIPQSPVLLSGTVRSNLDPFGEYADGILSHALEQVHWTKLAGVPSTNALDAPISTEGSNCSHGQRQLLCLARAMLAKPAVMILDEATSAVDRDTDELIQQSIRANCQGTTLLVIAHRIQTIADFDKVLVLDNGEVVEFGPPATLMARNGLFTQMVKADANCGARENYHEAICQVG
ncbi:P-loop containing nucleoside triphosphate hydrolase protein [Aspergillus steynii IBT 23096]|uniref:P-loop containing nucleoside triphosphate hydrolase protein n=1 Tax=Aspergillus steynii IBT 23096 TaxID=1392250 RepID=A0A2I2G3N0_9EURO|nr:P-loop containing nucleoside triphosphate hydrolase protein [Aspergillus steynii IBT 23096]PLB47488.1 P-loop containing nucleoside triphosphate hydrolase protein [Aspergillus steynii IBT 23096]